MNIDENEIVLKSFLDNSWQYIVLFQWQGEKG
jgi:hypothetical protein